MTFNPSKNILVATLAMGIAVSGLVAVPVTPALAQANPAGANTTSTPNFFAIWPDNLDIVATGKRGDYRDVAINLAGNKEGIRMHSNDLPRGAQLMNRGNEWFVRVPVQYPIDRTFSTIIATNAAGMRDEKSMVIAVYPGWDPNLPDPGDFPDDPIPPTTDPTPPPAPPVPNPTPTTEPPAPTPTPTADPTQPPAPGPTEPTPPPAGSGPVVTIANGSYVEGSRHTHPVRITPASGVELKQGLWYDLPGFDLEYVTGNEWRIVIEPTVKAGKYTVKVQGEDANGKIGAIGQAEITITPKNTPQPNPTTPAPTPTTPAPNPTTPAPQPNQGPVVSAQGGTYSNTQEHRVPITASPEVDQLWYYETEGFDLGADVNGWWITIKQGAKVGNHKVRLYATDKSGKKGPEIEVPFTITPGNTPVPQPTPTTQPTTPAPQPTTNPGNNAVPRVVISDAKFDNRKENVLAFTVEGGQPNKQHQLWWERVQGMKIRPTGMNKWELVIEKGIRPDRYQLQLWSTDSQGNEGPIARPTITITGAPVNAAPVMHGANVSVRRGHSLKYNVPVTDPDGDAVTLKIVGGKERWMSVRGTTLELRPDRRVYRGTYRVTLEATDGNNHRTRATFTITVR